MHDYELNDQYVFKSIVIICDYHIEIPDMSEKTSCIVSNLTAPPYL